jgi:hypothetical protein
MMAVEKLYGREWKRMEKLYGREWKRMEKCNAMIKYMSYNEMGLSIYATV